jgi:serine/threonine-protein kinase
MLKRRSTTEGVLETSSSQAGLQAALGAHYALERELGRGGMATVYLARDLRHRRQVAVKVLHPELSAVLGPDRFLREIEVTAALQHPHILPLFDSGSANGLLYYVMPYVAGESLRARLTRERQLPIDDAIRLAREVADALDHAHAQGIVHRDIKPENILLQGGHALVADFGVALAVQQAGGQRMTQTGLSLGTPQYMAPEQATGEKAVDARADVYALGAVTYEMLTGEPPFTGVSTQALIGKLLTDDPVPLTRHRRSVPSHVEAAVLRALEKLPADRLPTAGAFAAALVDPAHEHGAGSRGPVRRASQRRHVTLTVLAGVATGALTIGLALGWILGRGSVRSTTGAAPRPHVRFAIDIDSGSLSHIGALAISPDGGTVVYGLDGQDGSHLYARPLDSLVARRLADTEDASSPFFSPDGTWVAFYSNGALRKVPLAGGPAVVIAEVPLPAWFTGGSWSETDTIYYAVATSKTLYRVSARGGTPSRIAVDDTGSTTPMYRFPHILPGGRGLLVTISNRDLGQRIGVLDLASGRLREFGKGSEPHYAADNLIYTGPGGVLFRRPFDTVRAEPTGAPEQIVAGLAFQMAGVSFDVSRTGALVYCPGSSPSADEYLQLKLFDRTGRELQVFPGRMPWSPRFSPDGRRIAYGALSPGQENTDIWVRDIDAGTSQRVTTDGNNNNDVQWSPDGTELAFSTNAPGGKDLRVQSLDGGPARSLASRPGSQVSTDWTGHGNAVLLTELPISGEHSSNQDIWIQPLDGSAARPYMATVAHENAARVSPDGKWVAYQSDEAGGYDVYVQAYPNPGRKWSVSVRGGFHPVWARNGRELFFWRGDQLMAVTVTPGATNEPLKFGTPASVFRAPYPKGTAIAGAMYDVAPDGKFVVVTSHGRESRLVVALDGLSADRPR